MDRALTKASNTVNKKTAVAPKVVTKETIDSIEKLESQINKLTSDWLNATDAVKRYRIEQELLSSRKLLSGAQNNWSGTKQINAGKIGNVSTPQVPVLNINSNFDPVKYAKDNEIYIKSLSDISFTSQEAQAAISSMYSSVSSISDNPGIRALAASLAVLNAVQGVAAATSPWEKVAAIVSLTAATASMFSTLGNKKFAGGGIVGDKNIIRANEGEMILNHQQQSRLFN
jgi:hypothetical protein